MLKVKPPEKVNREEPKPSRQKPISSNDELPYDDDGYNGKGDLENDPSGVLELILHVHVASLHRNRVVVLV